MTELEQALRLAISDSRTDEKLQATSYLEKLKSTPEGFQQSLTLIQQIRTTNVQVVFFCFQVIDSVVSSRYSDLDLQTRKQVRDTLWQLLIDHTQDPIPFFLRNKLFLLVVLVFRFEYVTNWTNFFIDLIKLKDASMVGLEAFLQICVLIDEEVVCKYIQRDSLNTQLNVEIKDKMRQSDIALLVENWLLIFHRHYQTHAQIATMCLEIFGLYVEWIDLGLILNETFIAQLYECLGKSELQSAACDCLCKVVSKGMNPIDKLELLKRLNLVGVLQNLNGSNDPEFLEQLAKLVNAIGLELCLCVTDSVDVQKNQTVLEMIGSIFPLILEHLGSEYDDTTECLFPFLTHYMIAIKKLQKNRFVAISNENLHRLVRILVLKMKYGSDVDFTSDNSNDDETAFFDMRKSLKVHVEVFSTIDRELCAGVINDIIFIALETLISYNVNPANGFSMEWTDYELAMYLIFIYTESNGTKGTIIYHNGTEFTPIGQILTKMFQSRISEYPHSAVLSLYFEIVTRYSLYFEVQKNSLPDVIGSFVDTRGLFNSHRTIRTRVNYLFLRFSKTLRNHLGQYAGDILQAIQPLLVVATPTVTSTAVLESTSDFESQLYLFEAIGYLISVVTIPDETQYQFVSMIVNPMLSRMEIILGSSMETATVVLLVCELGHIICAIGAISKGFPDFDGPSGQKKWQQPFLLTLQAINLVLQRFHSFKTIRDSTKFAIQRLSGCVGPEVLELLPQMINSGLLGSDSSQELLEFLPFLNQIVFKFGLSVFNMMNVVWTPLRSKIGTYLQTEPNGTDERRIFLDILKAEYSLMNSMFIARISGVLCSPENITGLGATLQQLMISLSEADDMQVKKIAISLLSKMVYCWGGDPTHLELPAVAVDSKNTKAKGSAAAGVKAKENLKREPLSGFNSFIFESLVPRMLTLPSSLSWKDSHGKMVGMEIALFHMTMFAVFNEIYLTLLQGIAIFANQLGGNLFEALSRRDKNDVYKCLKVIYENTASLPSPIS